LLRIRRLLVRRLIERLLIGGLVVMGCCSISTEGPVISRRSFDNIAIAGGVVQQNITNETSSD
jgi:hypothetical protein